MKAYNILNMGAKKNTGYGYLYNWYAASNANFTPTDWKVPSHSDFYTLITNIGGENSTTMGSLKTVGTIDWEYAEGTNTSGFSAKGSGFRADSGNFGDLYTRSLFMRIDILGIYMLAVNKQNIGTFYYSTTEDNKKNGLPVRLLWNGVGTPSSTMTDYDGNVYDVIQIGSQYWTKQNWKCTHLNDGTPIPNVTDGTAWAALTTPGRCAYNNDESYV